MKYFKFLIFIMIVSISTFIIITITKERENNQSLESEKIVMQSSGNVNMPVLLEGMRPVIFEDGNENAIEISAEEMKEGIWYDYIAQDTSTENGGTSKWANAMTLDGSLWVWIPRFAYKIDYEEDTNNVGTIDVIFLSGNSNKSMDGVDVTTLGYKVHPAFKNGTNSGFENGEWDKEITGIWVAKFEAGYAGQKNTASENVKILETQEKYSTDGTTVMGEYEEDETYMTYPVFMGKTISYNNIKIGDMYTLSLALNRKK